MYECFTGKSTHQPYCLFILVLAIKEKVFVWNNSILSEKMGQLADIFFLANEERRLLKKLTWREI